MIEGLLIASAYGGVGIVLSIIAYFLFDLVEWKIDYSQEIKNGNTAAAIVVAAFVLGVCIVISRAIGS